MAIPKLNYQDIVKALTYIDVNGVPSNHQSVRYELIGENGKKYPPKYVIAVANHLANGGEISTATFHGTEARIFLQQQGFPVEVKEQTYQLTITAEGVTSTDEEFPVENLGYGDYYRPLEVYFQRADGQRITRKRRKSEQRNSNMTLPRLACQVFEEQIAALSVEEREHFPICRYKPGQDAICGIYGSVDEFKRHRNTLEYIKYYRSNGELFVFYCWNIFSTLLFVQECLKRFGVPGDEFVLRYREKEGKEPTASQDEEENQGGSVPQGPGYQNPYSSMLLESKNVIFRGAPGTGKSYLARSMAADIISNGETSDYNRLTPEQRKQVEFVQFHPSYDYSDFVEGLRPKVNEDGSMGFELQDGVFKKFIARARKNYEDSQKPKEVIQKEVSAQDAMENFFSSIELDGTRVQTISGNEFYITSVDDQHVQVSIPGNATVKRLRLNIDEISSMLESGQRFEKIKDVTNFFGKRFATQEFSYDFAIYKAIQATKYTASKRVSGQEALKKYVFIMDEINRGEISKIFGELFFAIDPGYRGRAGEVSTQYANLHADPDEKFFIPENVYIIGTMNDIDRSVDSFDFAMRRRFRFVELKADECLDMLDQLEDEVLEAEAIRRMSALNREIVKVEDLNENYQIGAAYFLKLKALTFDQLWTDYLQPLLQDYIRGMYDEESIMQRLAKAYGYQQPDGEKSDEAAEN